MKVTTAQVTDSVTLQVAAKLDHLLASNDAEYANLSNDERADFISGSIDHSASLGLRSESAWGAYALCAWWLEIGFEARSEALDALLKSQYPEPRKVHAMLEWVQAHIEDRIDPVYSQEKLLSALETSASWGAQ